MDEIRYTLISDGSSDRALLPILTWVLREKGGVNRIQPEWADLNRLPRPPKALQDRILAAIDLFPCDLFFLSIETLKEKILNTDTRKYVMHSKRSLPGISRHRQSA